MPAVLSKASKFTHLSSIEKDQIERWTKEGKKPAEIAKLLARSLSTITGFLKDGREGAGRPLALSDAQVKRLCAKARIMIKAADAQWQVTAGMLKKALGLKCCERVILDALHSQGIYFFRLREKLPLTPEDVRARLEFAETHSRKAASWWEQNVHAFLDNKLFPIFLDAKGRKYAAKRVARGAFRSAGESLTTGHIKPKSGIKYNYSSKAVTIACAICADKVLMWHEVSGNWTGDAAAYMYTSKLAPALRRHYPDASRFVLLEDNDHSGYKSNKGKVAKAEAGIRAMEFPKRSPDLNPLDYSIWSEVNRRMRAQEKRFRPSFRETSVAYKARLRRTAMNLSEPFLRSVVACMKRRVVACKAAKGNHFEESP